MCKCQDTTNFKKALRVALSETTEKVKMAVWENKANKNIHTGTVKEAELRLKNGTIECYFIPKNRDKEISFSIVDKVESVPEKDGKEPDKSKQGKPSGK